MTVTRQRRKKRQERAEATKRRLEDIFSLSMGGLIGALVHGISTFI